MFSLHIEYELTHCSACLLAIITGSESREAIKVWDPRAKAIVYELATGNNGVVSMAWDAPRSTLFAATRCSYRDRLGYCRAKIPKQYDQYHKTDSLARGGAEMDVDGDESEDEDCLEERCWPERAYHDETYFGIALDAGGHRLCEWICIYLGLQPS